jgi:o-succinylbenzoate---CoA ligase
VPQLVALLLPPGPGFVDALRRVWDAGDAALPLDARLPDPAVRRLLDVLAPGRIVGPDGKDERLARGRPVEDGDALVVATSGTTGEPKGVILTHAAVAASALATSSRLGVDAERHHWLCCLPVAHVGGLGVVTRALWARTPLTVLARFDASSLADALDAGATHVSVVATMLAAIDPGLVAGFDRVVLGGSAVPPDLPDNVVATYGLTETGSGCVYDGVPLDGVDVRVDDEGGIQLRGGPLLRAYRSAAGELDPFLPGGWFATGDLGAWDPTSGRLRVFGRAGDLIITGGQNVWPDPVEQVLSTVPGVAEAAVVGRPDPRWGAAVTAVVVAADPAAAPTLDDLRAAVKEQLAPYCAPHRLELVDSLPRTALGKLRRSEL